MLCAKVTLDTTGERSLLIMTIKKEFANLVKPMLVKDAPKGLYNEKCVWMEAKDLEGFNAHFSFRFIKSPTANFHPLEGAIVHPLRLPATQRTF
jgi:hypothetical protein